MKRSSYLKYDQYVELGKGPLKIWAYGKKENFVCRLEITAAGLAAYSGPKGKKLIANVTWERLVSDLSKK